MKTLIAIAAVVAAATPVFAQNYPSKPVCFIYEYVTWEFATYIKQELKASADLVKLAHVKPD